MGLGDELVVILLFSCCHFLFLSSGSLTSLTELCRMPLLLPMIILYVFINFLGLLSSEPPFQFISVSTSLVTPADDLFKLFVSVIAMVTQQLRCGYRHIPPTIMAIIAAFMQGGIYNFGLGTLFALAFQGAQLLVGQTVISSLN